MPDDIFTGITNMVYLYQGNHPNRMFPRAIYLGEHEFRQVIIHKDIWAHVEITKERRLKILGIPIYRVNDDKHLNVG